MGTRIAVLAVLAASLSACGGGRAKKAAPAAAQAGPRSASQEPDIRGVEHVRSAELKTVRFDYDRDALGDEARAVLKANAEALRRNPEWQVLVEGHCDERGTVAYNAALGQRRAKAVRDYYMALGIAGSRIATISYGEERPACAEPSEECRARNRRAPSLLKVEALASQGSKAAQAR